MLAKYQERRFVAMHAADLAQLPGSSLQDSLWTAVAQGSLQLVMRCLVGGADLQFRCGVCVGWPCALCGVLLDNAILDVMPDGLQPA